MTRGTALLVRICKLSKKCEDEMSAEYRQKAPSVSGSNVEHCWAFSLLVSFDQLIQLLYINLSSPSVSRQIVVLATCCSLTFSRPGMPSHFESLLFLCVLILTLTVHCFLTCLTCLLVKLPLRLCFTPASPSRPHLPPASSWTFPALLRHHSRISIF